MNQLADTIVLTGRLVWTLLCILTALIALGIIAVIVLAIL